MILLLIRHKFFGIFASITISLIKVFIIDADIPVFDIAFYLPCDEIFYARYAYDMFSTGDPFFDSTPSILLKPIITNISTYIGLIIFGDTYHGLRFGSLLLGTFSIFIFWRILTKITNNTLLINGFTILLAVNFSFSLASIVVEPTIARTAMMLLSIWIIFKICNQKRLSKWRSFFGSFSISFFFFITYPTNAFLLPAAFFAYALTSYRSEKVNSVIKQLAIYGMGYLIAFLFIYLTHNTIGSRAIETIVSIENYSNRVSFNIVQQIQNIIGIANANFFRFNSLIAVLFITSFFVFYNFYRKKIGSITPPQIIIGCFIIFFALQTIFINDYAPRKLIIFLPLVFLFIASIEDAILHFFNKEGFLLKTSIIVSSAALVVFIQLNVYPKEFLTQTSTLFSFFVLSGWLILLFLTKHLQIIKKHFLFATILFVAAPEIYLFNKYYIEERSYHYKNTYKSLNEYNNQLFLGGMSIGYQLYNDIKCQINPYAYYNKANEYEKRIIELGNLNNDATFSIGYCYNLEFYKSLGYSPVDTLMPKEETVREFDVIVYKKDGLLLDKSKNK